MIYKLNAILIFLLINSILLNAKSLDTTGMKRDTIVNEFAFKLVKLTSDSNTYLVYSQYKKDKLDGAFMILNKDFTPLIVGHHRKGKKHGTWWQGIHQFYIYRNGRKIINGSGCLTCPPF